MMTCNINYFLKYIEELDPTELIASMRIIGVQSIFKIKDEDLDKLDETIDWHIKDADRKLEEILDKVNSNHWLDVTEKILKDEDAGQATVQAAIKACDGFEGEIKKYTQLRDGIKEEKDDLLGELSSQEASLENPEIRNRLESNIREALKGQSDQEMVDKYINMYLNKIGPCFSRDIQRMQKLMPIYIKAEDACNKILDHYKNQYDSLTKLLVTPIK